MTEHLDRPTDPLLAPPTPPMAVDPAPAPPTPPRTEGTAIAALVCAIGSWFLLPVLLAVVALVLARRAERAISADAGTNGHGLVTAARWVAWLNLLLAAMVVAFVAAFTLALRLGL